MPLVPVKLVVSYQLSHYFDGSDNRVSLNHMREIPLQISENKDHAACEIINRIDKFRESVDANLIKNSFSVRIENLDGQDVTSEYIRTLYVDVQEVKRSNWNAKVFVPNDDETAQRIIKNMLENPMNTMADYDERTVHVTTSEGTDITPYLQV